MHLLELGSFEPESFHVDVALNGQHCGGTGLQFLYTAPVRVPEPDYNVTGGCQRLTRAWHTTLAPPDTK